MNEVATVFTALATLGAAEMAACFLFQKRAQAREEARYDYAKDEIEGALIDAGSLRLPYESLEDAAKRLTWLTSHPNREVRSRWAEADARIQRATEIAERQIAAELNAAASPLPSRLPDLVDDDAPTCPRISLDWQDTGQSPPPPPAWILDVEREVQRRHMAKPPVHWFRGNVATSLVRCSAPSAPSTLLDDNGATTPHRRSL